MVRLILSLVVKKIFTRNSGKEKEEQRDAWFARLWITAEGLALGIVNKMFTHPCLKKPHIDVAAMLAGTKFRGDFEQRAQNIINKLSQNSIVFIEIHTCNGCWCRNKWWSGFGT